MTDEPLDSPLYRYTDDSLARPLHPALPKARADVVAAARGILTIPETALARPWGWIGGSEEEVRYGAYRAAEALELAEIEARQLAAASDTSDTRAARLIGPTTAARWDLHGVLLPMDDALLDADPGGGEWTVRLTMGHIIGGQRGYGWGQAWWLGQGLAVGDPAMPSGAPESLWAAQPDEATTEASGTVEVLLARLDGITDLTTERFAGGPDEQLALAATWAGFKVTLGFRLGRWSSHIREHVIQIEKTFAMVGHVPDERARLVRNLLAAYGRAEAVVFGRADVDASVGRIAAGAAEAKVAVESAATAAAGPP
jgi:DinB superfamily